VNINSHVAPGPTELPQLLQQRRNASLRYRTILILRQEHADTSHALILLPARRERPCSRRAAKQRDERAPVHSITSSARPSNVIGTVMSSALAVLTLMISSSFVSCCTGKSVGFSPLRMRPA